MKRTITTIIAVAFVAASLTSCKKTHTCSCTYGGTTTDYPFAVKQSKADAKKSCDALAVLYSGSCSLK